MNHFKIFQHIACFFAFFFLMHSGFAQIPQINSYSKGVYEPLEFHSMRIVNTRFNHDPKSTTITINNESNPVWYNNIFLGSGWVIVPSNDGRFSLRVHGAFPTCLTSSKTESIVKNGVFTRKYKKAISEDCSKYSDRYSLFVQKSGVSTNGLFEGYPKYVIRSVEDPSMCLSLIKTVFNVISATRPSTPHEIVGFTSCSQAKETDDSDRWVFVGTDKIQPSINSNIDMLATGFALNDYKDNDTHKPIYNQKVDFEMNSDELQIDLAADMKRLSFHSPFSDQKMETYVNATPTTQQLHVERFNSVDWSVSVEAGAGKLLELFAGIKLNINRKTGSQENTKLWQFVPPYSSMWFVGGFTKETGIIKVNITTDLGDNWIIQDSRYKSKRLSALIVCTDDSIKEVCKLTKNMDLKNP